MGKRKRAKPAKPRVLNPNDDRVKNGQKAAIKKKHPPSHAEKKGFPPEKKKPAPPKEGKLQQVQHVPSSMFLSYNTALGPPYQIIVDTNFINFSIQHKIDVMKGMIDCLLAKCTPCVTDCVVGELEKMGHRFLLALRLARDPRFKRLTCTHKGTYADDCIVDRITQHKCYIVATNDRDLKRRIRKVPGVPIMYVTKSKYSIERMPDAITAVPIK